MGSAARPEPRDQGPGDQESADREASDWEPAELGAEDAGGGDAGVEDAGAGDAGAEKAGAEEAGAGGLDEFGQRALAFERQWWRNAGAKDQAVRDTFGLSPTRYYQLLNALLDEPAAMAADPVLVRRLRRLRSSRTVR